MTRVLVGHAFAFEHMPEVAATVSAKNFDSPAVRVGFAFDGLFDFVVETRPTAPGMKLVLRALERCVAPAADVRTIPFGIHVFARTRRLRPFAQDDAGFFFRQTVVLICHSMFPRIGLLTSSYRPSEPAPR